MEVSGANRAIGSAAIQTPCIGVCVMDRSGYCRGCARTLEEIGAWTSMSHPDRASFMAELPARKAALGSDYPS